jgi:hypothetical protein
VAQAVLMPSVPSVAPAKATPIVRSDSRRDTLAASILENSSHCCVTVFTSLPEGMLIANVDRWLKEAESMRLGLPRYANGAGVSERQLAHTARAHLAGTAYNAAPAAVPRIKGNVRTNTVAIRQSR